MHRSKSFFGIEPRVEGERLQDIRFDTHYPSGRFPSIQTALLRGLAMSLRKDTSRKRHLKVVK